MDATITLKEYLEKRKDFVIPDYQRGYVWGKKKKGNDKDSETYILEDSLIPGFENDTPIFIQGITVTEKEKEIVLIDGQQRTTFFYLLLKYLGYEGSFELRYDIRKKSHDFLKSIMEQNFNEEEKEYQDVYFFKKTLRIIDTQLKGYDMNQRKSFLDYVLNKVKFLFIDIPEDKATKVFSMMNGNKAEMKVEELIKAELLRLASQNDANFERKEVQERHAIEWDNNMLRSRYAREWDKWLQWWNRDDVKALYKTNHVMGLLISTYQKGCQKDGEKKATDF